MKIKKSWTFLWLKSESESRSKGNGDRENCFIWISPAKAHINCWKSDSLPVNPISLPVLWILRTTTIFLNITSLWTSAQIRRRGKRSAAHERNSLHYQTLIPWFLCFIHLTVCLWDRESEMSEAFLSHLSDCNHKLWLKKPPSWHRCLSFILFSRSEARDCMRIVFNPRAKMPVSIFIPSFSRSIIYCWLEGPSTGSIAIMCTHAITSSKLPISSWLALMSLLGKPALLSSIKRWEKAGNEWCVPTGLTERKVRTQELVWHRWESKSRCGAASGVSQQHFMRHRL